MGKLKNGSVDSAQTVKAGCGIRYDPEQLDEDCGFDFSGAQQALETGTEQTDTKQTKNDSASDKHD